MKSCDVIVVGGGPAGSSCAARLVDGGAKVIVLDRAEFPRLKLCAGWVTPKVMSDLKLDICDYPHRLNTFDHLKAHFKGLFFKIATTQHSIRRLEFDDFLLLRSGAEFSTHRVKAIARTNGSYIIDGKFRSKFLVGAGGTSCPVYRAFFREENPRSKNLQVAALEYEFPYDWDDENCHLFFLDNGLPGYSWYVPKQNGFLNCGIGGMAERMRRRRMDLKSHWVQLQEKLSEKGLVKTAHMAPTGYSYYLRGGVSTVRIENAFIVGDSAGLATLDLAEGIGPAVKSGQLAADSILLGSEYTLRKVPAYSPIKPWISGLLDKYQIWKELRKLTQSRHRLRL